MTDGGAPADQHGFDLAARASSFGANAVLYDETRPSYPDALVDDLVGSGSLRVLDVGCGTGILGRALQARGAEVLGVEPDDKMADVARHKGLAVELGTFEGWDDAGRRFELLVAGQAWHWVDPVEGAAKAARVVSPAGRVVLVWNDAVMPDDLKTDLDAAYARHAPHGVHPTVRHRPSDWLASGGSEAAFVDLGAFDDPVHVTYPWEREYTAGAWCRQLETHSDHALMDPAERARLVQAVGAAIEARGGAFTMHYDCRATTFTRR